MKGFTSERFLKVAFVLSGFIFAGKWVKGDGDEWVDFNGLTSGLN